MATDDLSPEAQAAINRVVETFGTLLEESSGLLAAIARDRSLSADLAARARLTATAVRDLAADLRGEETRVQDRDRTVEQCLEIRASLHALGWSTADLVDRWQLDKRTAERLCVPRPDVPVTMRALAIAALKAELRSRGF